MPDTIVNSLPEYGIAGVTILILLFLMRVLFQYLEKKDKEHIEERQRILQQLETTRLAWEATHKEQFNQIVEVTEKSNSIVQQNTNIVADVRSLLTSLIVHKQGR